MKKKHVMSIEESRVRNFFLLCSGAYDIPKHPTIRNLRRMIRFITGFPLIRFEILTEFYTDDYDELFGYNNSFYAQNSDIIFFSQDRGNTLHQIEIKKESSLSEIEFDVIDDFKNFEIKPEGKKDVLLLINRLLKKIEKYNYVHKISDKDDTRLNRIGKILMERIDTYLNSNGKTDIKNNFDDIDIQTVYNHFHIRLVEEKCMSEDDLNLYLSLAFDKREVPENKFILSGRRFKENAYNAFYEYYKEIAVSPRGRQRDYASLLGDYFQGFNTNTVSTNFSAYYNIKKK